MAVTKISDVIVPEVFNPYVSQRSAELSALYRSGIIVPDEQLDTLARTGGTILNMPFWNDLTGESEPLDDDDDLEPDNIDAGKDQARLHARGKAWGVHDLAEALSGSDPTAAIGDKVAEWWAWDKQRMTFATLKGVFGAASMAGNALDISGTSGAGGVISSLTIIDAQYKLGDAADKLTAFSMHSSVFARLQKDGLIEYQVDPVTGARFPTYLNTSVVVDDGHPVEGNVFTSYLFGRGAIGLGKGEAPVPTEVDRNSLGSTNYLINRDHFILHPRGIKWKEAAVTGKFPTNAELATAANWERVYDPKNIRIVQFKHRIA